jgi:endoglucanase
MSLLKRLMGLLAVAFIIFTQIDCKSTEKTLDNENTVRASDLLETEQPLSVKSVLPFSRGVNFTEWFETQSAESIIFTKYTEQDFSDAKSLGVDVIRLPIRMHSMTGPGPEYRIDSMLLRFLDMAVDWAEKYEIHIIIDNHSFDPAKDTANDIDAILLPVWTQMAEHFSKRGDYVLYEVLNEPHGISDKRWGEIQGMVIDTIRKYDTRHAIVVGGTNFNSIDKLHSIPRYNDSNLIYTFHYYDPFMFTHQGASWSPPMEYLGGVPFPYNAKRMPILHNKIRNTWIANNLRNEYKRESDVVYMRKTLDKAVAFSNERGVPVFCGEYGVYDFVSPPADRAVWYEVATDMLDKRNIPRTSWDYFGGFGIYNKGGGKDFNRDLNVAIVRAMGFTPPEQLPRYTAPLEKGFVIYDDYPTREYSLGCWGEGIVFNLYETNAYKGEFCIRWGNVDQYNSFWVSLSRSKKFSKLASSGFALEFYAKTDTALSFDVRFVNPEGGFNISDSSEAAGTADSIPWRIRYTIDEKRLPPDGKWHKIRILFEEMTEHGAWVNTQQKWIPPEGKFTWDNIYQLEFVSEHHDLKNKYICFDEIRITDEK